MDNQIAREAIQIHLMQEGWWFTGVDEPIRVE